MTLLYPVTIEEEEERPRQGPRLRMEGAEGMKAMRVDKYLTMQIPILLPTRKDAIQAIADGRVVVNTSPPVDIEDVLPVVGAGDVVRLSLTLVEAGVVQTRIKHTEGGCVIVRDLPLPPHTNGIVDALVALCGDVGCTSRRAGKMFVKKGWANVVDGMLRIRIPLGEEGLDGVRERVGKEQGGVKVVYEDKDVAVVFKPRGWSLKGSGGKKCVGHGLGQMFWHPLLPPSLQPPDPLPLPRVLLEVPSALPSLFPVAKSIRARDAVVSQTLDHEVVHDFDVGYPVFRSGIDALVVGAFPSNLTGAAGGGGEGSWEEYCLQTRMTVSTAPGVADGECGRGQVVVVDADVSDRRLCCSHLDGAKETREGEGEVRVRQTATHVRVVRVEGSVQHKAVSWVVGHVTVGHVFKQVRRALAAAGHPVLGKLPFMEFGGTKKTYLVRSKLSFLHPVTGEEVVAEMDMADQGFDTFLDREAKFAERKRAKLASLVSSAIADPTNEWTEEDAGVLATMPEAYLRGSADFCGLSFRVTGDVLIPRKGSEVLVSCVVEEVCRRWRTTANTTAGEEVRVLDLGTGSGCLLIASAAKARAVVAEEGREEERGGVFVGYGMDLCEKAVAVAESNASSLLGSSSSSSSTRVQFGVGDFSNLSTVPEEMVPIDIVVSNPPYVSDTVFTSLLSPDVYEHEPSIALLAGAHGIGAYQAIARSLETHVDLLASDAVVVLEVGAGHDPDRIASFFSPLFSLSTTHRDHINALRSLVLRRT